MAATSYLGPSSSSIGGGGGVIRLGFCCVDRVLDGSHNLSVFVGRDVGV